MYLHPADLSSDDPDLQNPRHGHRHHRVLYRERQRIKVTFTEIITEKKPPPEFLTLCAMGSDDAHGADPVRRDLGHQRVQDLQAGGVHHEDFWVVAVTEQTSLPLSADGELIELEEKRKKRGDKF